MSALSEKLKELRGSSSQKEMADAVGIKVNAWARYERGEVSPGAEILRQICIAHECSSDWLLGLPCRGTSITASGSGSIAAGHNSRITVNGRKGAEKHDCINCKFKKFADAFKAIQSPI